MDRRLKQCGFEDKKCQKDKIDPLAYILRLKKTLARLSAPLAYILHLKKRSLVSVSRRDTYYQVRLQT